MPKTSEPSPLLLDTHIWLWQILATGELSPSARSTINDAAAAGTLTLSIMSIWEIALLASRNRVVLGKPIMGWVEDGLDKSRATLEPLSPEIAVESCHLPDGFRSDPADQIIVATARITGATLMTRDHRILQYAAGGAIRALSA